MSFNDLERGTYNANLTATPGTAESDEQEYRKSIQQVSRQVFQINASVANIRQLVGQLGTSRDTSRLRQDIQHKMEATRQLVKTTSQGLKQLGQFGSKRQRRLEQQKLTGDFQRVLEQFQNIQRVSAEVTREFVDRAKHAVHEQQQESDETSPLLQQQSRMELAVLDNDVEYNEALINERESEINEIEQGIVELNEVFRDLGTIVGEQQSLLDNIESNVHSVSMNTLGASDQLHTASEHQRRGNKLQFCLLLFAIIFIIVLLLVAIS